MAFQRFTILRLPGRSFSADRDQHMKNLRMIEQHAEAPRDLVPLFDQDADPVGDEFPNGTLVVVNSELRMKRSTGYGPAVTAGTVPTGAMMMYGGAAAPAGWLLCDGSLASRTTYAALFAAIGTAFGAGDGSTTFQLPDLRQRFPLGKAPSAPGAALGETGGSVNGPTGAPSATTDAVGGTTPVASSAHTHTQAMPPYQTVNFIVKT